MAQRFVNIVLAFAFFIEPVALQGLIGFRCYEGMSANVPGELRLKFLEWGMSPSIGLNDCYSDDDKRCVFFECKAQNWYFVSCSKAESECFGMHSFCVKDECQTCHTDHCNLPLSMRPNSTTTIRATSTSTTTRATSTSTTTRATSTSTTNPRYHTSSTSKNIAKGISTKIGFTPAKTTQIPDTKIQNSENGTSHGVEVPLPHNGTDKSVGLSAKVAPLYVLALLLSISQAFLWFIEKMPAAKFGPQASGPQALGRKLGAASFGAASFGPQASGPQASGPQVSGRKFRAAFRAARFG
uniref:Chitin-binding type-2 domain-containing protein n=1 Tax=Globodera pallida TaxID=36090 RepID=A0A183BKV7_GLOPA